MHEADIRVFDSPALLKSFAAEHIVGTIEQTASRPVPFSLVLSGGSTPREVYEEIARLSEERAVPWDNTHLFWGDERCVSPDAQESNFGMVWNTLLYRIKIPDTHVHRIKGELPPQQGAHEYENDILRFAGSLDALFFDLVLLGLGDDGHTASLFPGSPALSGGERIVAVGERNGIKRVTLTMTAINKAREVLFIVSGRKKAPAVRDTLMENGSADKFPARGVCPPKGRVQWFLDREAASLIG